MPVVPGHEPHAPRHVAMRQGRLRAAAAAAAVVTPGRDPPVPGSDRLLNTIVPQGEPLLLAREEPMIATAHA
jgi:hypothetical protein